MRDEPMQRTRRTMPILAILTFLGILATLLTATGASAHRTGRSTSTTRMPLSWRWRVRPAP